MSTPVTPTSPKAADAGLPAVQKEYDVRRPARRRDADTIADTIDDTIPCTFHSDRTAESSGILSCLQNFACSIWSCVSDFFGWVANLFSSARDNPELLANPLKQIENGLAIWKDPKGAMTQLVNEVRKGSQDAEVKLSFDFTPCQKVSSYSNRGFCRQRPEPIYVQVAHLADPAAVKQFTDELVVQTLKKAEADLKNKKLYVDLDWDDSVRIEIRAELSIPIVENEYSEINTITIEQNFENAWDASERDESPRIDKYFTHKVTAHSTTGKE